MNNQLLAALERAIEPYRHAGFIVISQSADAITLIHSQEKFNYLLFISLIVLFWPLAIFYVISFNNRRDRTVCVRITSQGYIEESGYTLDLVVRERRRERLIVLVVIGIFTLLVLSAVAVLMSPQPGIQ